MCEKRRTERSRKVRSISLASCSRIVRESRAGFSASRGARKIGLMVINEYAASGQTRRVRVYIEVKVQSLGATRAASIERARARARVACVCVFVCMR